jgi:DNA-binding response OmpR family regulator
MPGKKILLVEDDENQRTLYRDELIQQGYEVDVAVDGDNALGRMESSQPDLLIMDICMPNRDGIETLRQMLLERPELPVIFNTAYGQYKSNFLTWAAAAYVVKSGDIQPLLDEVKRVIEPKERRSAAE